LTEARKRMMKMEWEVMRSIRKHDAATIYEIIDDLKASYPKKEEIFECLAMLMETDIISFSTQHCDFCFHPDVALSKLTKDVERLPTPTITVDEYTQYGWRKLAGLPPKDY